MENSTIISLIGVAIICLIVLAIPVLRFQGMVFNVASDLEYYYAKQLMNSELEFGEFLKLTKISQRIKNKHSFIKMLLSFKPLDIEYWYDDEEV